MKYKIIILKRAIKFIQKQPFKIQEKILREIYKLPSGDVRPMKGYKDLYRLRIDSIRVIYTVNNESITITVIDAENRGQIYKRY